MTQETIERIKAAYVMQETIMQPYKTETVETFKKIYSERKETIDYLEKFGNRFEKAQAILIKEAIGMSKV